MFHHMIFFHHWDGISRRRLGQTEGIGSAIVERWFERGSRTAPERTVHCARPDRASISISFAAPRVPCPPGARSYALGQPPSKWRSSISKQRIDPLIEESAVLRELVDCRKVNVSNRDA